MNRREAGLILGISPSAQNSKIKAAHKRIMLLNHPDRGKQNVNVSLLMSRWLLLQYPWRKVMEMLTQIANTALMSICVTGGSPYLAAKINEAKDFLDSGK
jgi:hypothetical protein